MVAAAPAALCLRQFRPRRNGDSAMLKHLVEEKKLTIVGAKYDLDDGVVTLM